MRCHCLESAEYVQFRVGGKPDEVEVNDLDVLQLQPRKSSLGMHVVYTVLIKSHAEVAKCGILVFLSILAN